MLPQNALIKMECFCGASVVSYKVRKITCAALNGSGCMSGIRVVFIYQPNKGEIFFVEMYYKGHKENEDRARLKAYIQLLHQE
jgi:hypothetical protein